MAGGNISPRQKMINMMYLVLTAMLALNVSAEVLQAFVKIEIGLDQAVEIARNKNIATLADFRSSAEEESKDMKPGQTGKIGPWAKKAELVRDTTEKFLEYVQNLKLELVRRADGPETFGIRGNSIIADSIQSLDNTVTGDEFFLGQAKKGRAYELEAKINEFKSFLFDKIITDSTGVMDEGMKSEINNLLSFTVKQSKSENRDWQQFTFEGTPLIANVATLTKTQVNALSIESSIMNYLKSQIGKTDFKISNIEAAVNNPAGTIVKGGTSKAEVFLIAYDANMKSKVIVGGREYPVVNGKAEITLGGSAVGNQVLGGQIFFTGPSGEEKRDFKIPYQVVEPSLVVSATKMNVFYLGVENPIDVSVAGVPMDKIKVSVSNGTLSGSGSQRSVMPNSVGKCVVSVSADINGVTKNMEGKEFRVKRLPTPTPSIFGINGKNIKKADLNAAQGIKAKMPEDFDFNFPIKITSFTVSLAIGGFTEEATATSEAFTEKQRSLFNSIKGSTRLMITDIKATGPAGAIEMPDLVYKVSN